MSIHIDDLLKATLAPLASFEEKQLIKDGDLGRCAAQVIRKQRRKLAWLRFSFGAFLCIPVMLMAFQQVFTPRGNVPLPILLLCIIPLYQLPSLSDVRASLTRLEMVASIWLMADNSNIAEPFKENEKSELVVALTDF